MRSIGVINTRSANLRSVCNAIAKVGADPVLISNAEELGKHKAVVLPGVGHVDAAMRELRKKGLDKGLQRFAAEERPIMGVCIGMQLLLDFSEEGKEPGLGLIRGRSVRIDGSNGKRVKLKIPHIGWNDVFRGPAAHHPLFRSIQDGDEFYFVHSYRCVPEEEATSAVYTDYKGVKICAGLAQNKVTGIQFHAEKSGDAGLQIYRNFINWALEEEKTNDDAKSTQLFNNVPPAP